MATWKKEKNSRGNIYYSLKQGRRKATIFVGMDIFRVNKYICKWIVFEHVPMGFDAISLQDKKEFDSLAIAKKFAEAKKKQIKSKYFK